MITEYPLTKANRIILARAFKDVPRVDLTIDCVLEAQMGQAFVDDVQHPAVFRIQAGPFVYFAGEAASPGGSEMLKNIAPYTLLMSSAPGWLEAARQMYGERLLVFDRYSFSSAKLSHEHLEQLCQASPFKDKVQRMDAAFATPLWGQEHFVDLSYFDSVDDFAQRGIGFYVAMKDAIAGASYSQLVCSKGIEVSLFVLPEYRRQGIATAVASHLLKWCLENGLDAHWDAANPESCKLAAKLGYKFTGDYLAYYLEA